MGRVRGGSKAQTRLGKERLAIIIFLNLTCCELCNFHKLKSQFVMFERKTMFGVAALGLSAVAGYGLYKYVRARQKAQQIKDAIDDMVCSRKSSLIFCSILNYFRLIVRLMYT